IPTGQTQPNASWPNGFNAFYCMKHEITQQAYVDFLNTLTYAQQAACTYNPPNSAAGTKALIDAFFTNQARNGIDIMTPGTSPGSPAIYACDLVDGNYDQPNDGQWIACNWLTGLHVLAY